MGKICFTGNKIGTLKVVNKGIVEISIVHIVGEYRPKGPAENSILQITKMSNGAINASYIPWVGYFDLDRENLQFVDKWKIIEPHLVLKYDDVIWIPFV